MQNYNVTIRIKLFNDIPIKPVTFTVLAADKDEAYSKALNKFMAICLTVERIEEEIPVRRV